MEPTYERYIESAEHHIKKGRYELALFKAVVVYALATADKREDLVRKSLDLINHLNTLVEKETEARATLLGVKVTPDNLDAIVQEFSPHWVKFNELLERFEEHILSSPPQTQYKQVEFDFN